MSGKSRDIVGKEEVGGGRDDYLTVVGRRNADTAGVAGVTLCIPDNFLYGRVDTESSGGMAPASPQAPSPSFDRQMICNAIDVDGIGSPGCIKEIYFRFK